MLKIQFALVVVLLAATSIAQAKEVTAQQAGVEYARKEAEKADAQHKADMRVLAEAEKLLEQRKQAFEQQTKQVAEDRKKAEASHKLVDEANVKYNKAQAILDQAWKD